MTVPSTSTPRRGPGDFLQRPAVLREGPPRTCLLGFLRVTGSEREPGGRQRRCCRLLLMGCGLVVAALLAPHVCPGHSGLLPAAPLGHCSNLDFSPSEWTPVPAFPKADAPSTAPPPGGKPWRGPWDARLSLSLCPHPSLFGQLPLHLWAHAFSNHTGLSSQTRPVLSWLWAFTDACPLPRKPTVSLWMSPCGQATGSPPPWHPVLSPRPCLCMSVVPGHTQGPLSGWSSRQSWVGGGCE